MLNAQQPSPPSGGLGKILDAQSRNPGRRFVQRCLRVDELNRVYELAIAQREPQESLFRAVLRVLDVAWDVSPFDLERIPKTGGVLLLANHPFGLVEGFAITAVLEEFRSDVRLMTNSLLSHFSEFVGSFILVNPFGGLEATRCNRSAMRDALLWLRQGGILVIFPAGEVSSFQLRHRKVCDPHWSESIARLARLANVPVLPAYFDGRNGAAFQLSGLVHPRLRTALLAREFLNKSGKSLEVRFGNLVPQAKLQEISSDRERIDYLRRKTYVLANRRQRSQTRLFRITSTDTMDCPQQSPVVPPACPGFLESEIAALDQSALLVEQGDHAVYIGEANQMPNIVREIGRLRELTFRNSGEGTGAAIDLDPFDSYYLHLFIWNRPRREIVGAYRLGQSNRILRGVGKRGLYTGTLFSYGWRFLQRISPALELGRSFVRVEYQKSYTLLLLLWRGIGAYLCRNPEYRFLFGPVSISNHYHPGSRQLMVSFLKQYCRTPDLARLVRARSPFRAHPLRGWEDEGASTFSWDVEALSGMIADIETDRKGVPILLKHYLKLGGKLVSFNVDPAFSNALDGLIVVDLLKSDTRLLARYFGQAGLATYLAFHAGQDTPARLSR
jgi:putative hemolysin